MTRFAFTVVFGAIAIVAAAQAAQAQQQWYFGMSITLDNSQYGKVLRVTGVTPNGPAQRAGLEVGDRIYSVNQRTFASAMNDFQARSILQQATGAPGGGVPTVQVETHPGTARMQVIDVQTGGIVPVVCYPNNQGGGGGGVPTGNANAFHWNSNQHGQARDAITNAITGEVQRFFGRR